MISKFKDSIKIPIILYVDVYPYRIYEKRGLLFLLLKRREDVILSDDWQVVCGKIKEGERIKDAFQRQIQSKTGQIPLELYKLDFINYFYDDYYDSVLMVPCAAAHLSSSQVKIDSNLHSEYKWVDYEEAKQLLAWENQRKCLDFIKDTLHQSSQSLRYRINYYLP